MIALATIGLVTIFGGTIAAVVSPPATPEMAGAAPASPAAGRPSSASPSPTAAPPAPAASAPGAPAGTSARPTTHSNTQSNADKGR